MNKRKLSLARIGLTRIGLTRIGLTRIALIMTIGITHQVYAGAFQLFEQSADGLGVAQAGAVAAGRDASTEYTNPAAMALFNQRAISGGLDVIFLGIHDDGYTQTTANIPLFSIDNKILPYTNGSADASITKLAPHLQMILPLSDGFYYGTGISAPFGLAVNYTDDSSATAYATTRSI